MSVILISAALALLAAWPLGVAVWLAASLAERLIKSPATREWIWSTAFFLPLLFLGEALVGPALLSLLRQGHPLTASSAAHVAAGHASAAHASMLAEFLNRPEAAWAAALVVGLSLLGLVVRLVRLILGARHLAGVVVRARPLDDPKVAAWIAAEANRMGSASAPVLVSSEIGQPLLAGMRRAAILIPSGLAETLDAESFSLIASHELAHLRRGDNRRMVADEAVLGLFWLTPLMGVVRSRRAAVAEEACDALALRGAESSRRRLYAETLVQSLRLGAGLEHQTAFTGASRRLNVMRINAILEPARPARTTTVVLVAAIGISLLCAAGVASQDMGERVKTALTSKPEAETKQGVEITADRFQEVTTNKGVFTGRPAIVQHGPSGGKSVDVRVRNQYSVNGQPAPEGFTPNSIAAESIDKIEVTTAKGQPTQINIVTKKPAG